LEQVCDIIKETEDLGKWVHQIRFTADLEQWWKLKPKVKEEILENLEEDFKFPTSELQWEQQHEDIQLNWKRRATMIDIDFEKAKRRKSSNAHQYLS